MQTVSYQTPVILLSFEIPCLNIQFILSKEPKFYTLELEFELWDRSYEAKLIKMHLIKSTFIYRVVYQ